METFTYRPTWHGATRPLGRRARPRFGYQRRPGEILRCQFACLYRKSSVRSRARRDDLYIRLLISTRNCAGSAPRGEPKYTIAERPSKRDSRAGGRRAALSSNGRGAAFASEGQADRRREQTNGSKSGNRPKKEGHRIAPGPLIMKVKNLQRGTADAVELGGKSHHVHQLSAI